MGIFYFAETEVADIAVVVVAAAVAAAVLVRTVVVPDIGTAVAEAVDIAAVRRTAVHILVAAASQQAIVPVVDVADIPRIAVDNNSVMDSCFEIYLSLGQALSAYYAAHCWYTIQARLQFLQICSPLQHRSSYYLYY